MELLELKGHRDGKVDKIQQQHHYDGILSRIVFRALEINSPWLVD